MVSLVCINFYFRIVSLLYMSNWVNFKDKDNATKPFYCVTTNDLVWLSYPYVVISQIPAVLSSLIVNPIFSLCFSLYCYYCRANSHPLSLTHRHHHTKVVITLSIIHMHMYSKQQRTNIFVLLFLFSSFFVFFFVKKGWQSFTVSWKIGRWRKKSTTTNPTQPMSTIFLSFLFLPFQLIV